MERHISKPHHTNAMLVLTAVVLDTPHLAWEEINFWQDASSKLFVEYPEVKDCFWKPKSSLQHHFQERIPLCLILLPQITIPSESQPKKTQSVIVPNKLPHELH